jgi:hypothetical protein
MANLDFYAVKEDLEELIEFLFSETDIVIFELSSQFECEARRFQSLSELEKVFRLGEYRAGYLQLWSPSVMKQPVIRRVNVTQVPGHSYRYAVEGAGLIQLYVNGIKDGVIHHTHYGHWNEAGARERSMHPADSCDWVALRKLSGRIQRHIRGKLASAKLFARPILRNAFSELQRDHGLWWGPEIKDADSADIKYM